MDQRGLVDKYRISVNKEKFYDDILVLRKQNQNDNQEFFHELNHLSPRITDVTFLQITIVDMCFFWRYGCDMRKIL